MACTDWHALMVIPDDVDPTELGMLDTSNLENIACTIIEGFENGGGTGGTGATVTGNGDGTIPMSNPLSPSVSSETHLPDQKLQIRHDCMWAGMCADQSHPEKSSPHGCGDCARQQPQQQQQPSQQPQQQQPSSAQNATAGSTWSGASSSADDPNRSGSTTRGSSILGSINRPIAAFPYTAAKTIKVVTPFKAAESSTQIPAGSSLLIKRQKQQQQHQRQRSPVMPSYHHRPPSPSSSDSATSGGSSSEGTAEQYPVRDVQVPYLPRASFLSAREQETRSVAAAQNHVRPDTPLSLDDDPPEFKHNIDLVACTTIGSNQQSLLHNSYTYPAVSGGSFTANSSSSSCGNSRATFGFESRGIGAFGVGRGLGVQCTCSNNGSISHTTECLQNFLQDMTMLDDPESSIGDGYYPQSKQAYTHHHHPHGGPQYGLLARPESPENQLEQLLKDLREIEGDSQLPQYHQHIGPFFPVKQEEGETGSASSGSALVCPPQHSSSAPCGGELMSGGAHAACSKECSWSSLELSHHHLASPGSSAERKRRHLHAQFGHRRRIGSGVQRGWISDEDEEDDEEDLLKQLDTEELPYEKQTVGGGGVGGGRDNYTNSSSWDDEEEEDEDEDDDEEDEEDEDESDEDEMEKTNAQEEDEEEEEMDEENDEEEDNGRGLSGRSSRHRYRGQHGQHRRLAAARATYRPYDVEAYKNGKKQKKQSSAVGRQLLANGGGVSTIIAGSGVPLKPGSMHGNTTKAVAPNGLGQAGSQQQQQQQQQQPGSNNSPVYQATHFGDHSYTRPKGGYNMNELGVQTPSDSDEEIDVVSIGDKNLPTNPTERDYRQLQSEVASKIRTARGATNGSHSYGAGSHHGYQRHAQHHADGLGAGVHHLGGIYPTPAGSTTISGANTPLPTGSGGVSAASSPPPAPCTSSTSRKRPIGGGSKRSSNSSKRIRLSHSKRDGGSGSSSSSSSSRHDSATAQALAEELDTVEKRNLHNNLERQRRIGLKNLFEELKRQIPQLRDKERAPKVNILREAAALCTRLNQEAEQVNELRQRQVKLYERVRYLRASIRSQRCGLD